MSLTLKIRFPSGFTDTFSVPLVLPICVKGMKHKARELFVLAIEHVTGREVSLSWEAVGLLRQAQFAGPTAIYCLLSRELVVILLDVSKKTPRILFKASLAQTILATQC